MKVTFADTFFYLALLNTRDPYHQKVIRILKTGLPPTVTTEPVLLELADALSNPHFRVLAADLIQELRMSSDVTVVALTSSILDKGLALYRQRIDKDWSLTDCISFVVMKNQGITEVQTWDLHF